MSKNSRPVIFIGADHRGFELKNQLIDWLKSQSYAVEDCGNRVFDPEDDYPDFAQKVASAVSDDTKSLGIVICGSGVGVTIAANRARGIRCALCFNLNQIKHARANDHINILALASDYFEEKQIQEMVTAFIKARPKNQEKYLRRIKKLDSGSWSCQCTEEN